EPCSGLVRWPVARVELETWRLTLPLHGIANDIAKLVAVTTQVKLVGRAETMQQQRNLPQIALAMVNANRHLRTGLSDDSRGSRQRPDFSSLNIHFNVSRVAISQHIVQFH